MLRPSYVREWNVHFSCSDLNHNKLKVIGMGAMSNLPELLTLILSSQNPRMEDIAYNAFTNIGAKLKYLWVSHPLHAFPADVSVFLPIVELSRLFHLIYVHSSLERISVLQNVTYAICKDFIFKSGFILCRFIKCVSYVVCIEVFTLRHISGSKMYIWMWTAIYVRTCACVVFVFFTMYNLVVNCSF